MQLQQGKQIAKLNLLRKCGLLAHTSAAFLKNCCTEKLFICLRLVPGCQQYYPLPSQKNRHRNFFRFHDGFSSALSPLLIHIEETEPSRICCKMFIQRCPIRESRVIHREIRGFQGAGIRIGTACYNNIVRTAIHII